MPRAIEFPAAGLSDGEVTLRLPGDADVPRIVEACSDPAVARYTTLPEHYRPSHAVEWMQRGLAGMSAGAELNLVVTSNADGDVLGTIGLHEINRLTGRAVAGYLIAPWARRRGIAVRSLRLVCRFAFEELKLGRIEVTIEPDNLASRATAEAVGFREEGLLRSYMPISGRRRDMLMYSLLPEDLGVHVAAG